MASIATVSQFNLDDVAVKRPKVQGVALVKAVLSGDTLLLQGSAQANGGTPLEKRVKLANIKVPQLALYDGKRDQPYAYDAREFLHSVVYGKVVEFILPFVSVDQANDVGYSKSIEYADITCGGVNISELMITKGYATVFAPPKKGQSEVKLSSEQEALLALEKIAKKQAIGIHSKHADTHVREVTRSPEVYEIYKQFSGKPQRVYVDRIIDGSTISVELNGKTPYQQYSLVVSLSGVLAPRIRAEPKNAKDTTKDAKESTPIDGDIDTTDAPPADDESTTTPSAPTVDRTQLSKQLNTYAALAKEYLEKRILYSHLTMTIDSIDLKNNVYVTLIHPTKGNIAEWVLRQGLGRYASWTAAALPPEVNQTLRSAAQSATTNLSTLGSPLISQLTPGKEYTATVTQVYDGERVEIKLDDGTVKRVNFSFISSPKLNYKGKNGQASEPWAFEAREFLRRSLIGKQVLVTPNIIHKEKKVSKKNGKQTTKIIEYVTMFKGRYNIAHELIAAGYSTLLPVIKDQPRVDEYYTFVLAQYKAKEEQKGIHGKKVPPVVIPDISPRIPVDDKNKKSSDKKGKQTPREESPEVKKANSTLKALQRNKEIPVVLDAIFSPTRYRVFIPSQHAYSTITLASIQSPSQTSEYNQLNEKVIRELRKWIQYDFLMEVVSMNRSSFLVNLINRVNGDVLNVTLVNDGYCTLIPSVVNHSRFKKQLLQAEQTAKKSRLGVWVDYDEEKEKLEKELARKAATETVGVYHEDGVAYMNVIVTDVADTVHFYINHADDTNRNVISQELESLNIDIPNDDTFTPSPGDIVAGLFEDDNKWYRVRIESHKKSSNVYNVQFIDFGNLSTIPYESLRPLPDAITKIKQLAKPCCLSGVKPPLPNSDYFELGSNVFANLAINKRFKARIDYTDNQTGLIHLTLFHDTHKEGDLSINQELLKFGLIRINNRAPYALKEMIQKELVSFEQEARDEHRNIFQYGDYSSDVEE